MSLFVDASGWTLAFRRDSLGGVPEVRRLGDALLGGEAVCATGLVLQELLQGWSGPRDGGGLSTALPTFLWASGLATITSKRREFATNVVAVALRSEPSTRYSPKSASGMT